MIDRSFIWVVTLSILRDDWGWILRAAIDGKLNSTSWDYIYNQDGTSSLASYANDLTVFAIRKRNQIVLRAVTGSKTNNQVVLLIQYSLENCIFTVSVHPDETSQVHQDIQILMKQLLDAPVLD